MKNWLYNPNIRYNNFAHRVIMLSFILMLISQINLFSNSYNAEIRLNTTKAPIKVENHKLYFGCFFEYLNDFINGTYGLWAQEIYDRGFDDKNNDFLRDWRKSAYPENIFLIKGGYNENGEYSVRLLNETDTSFCGITQKTYYDLDKGNIFYIYLKNNSNNLATLKIILKSSKTREIYYSGTIKAQSGDWKKYTLEIPKLNASHSDIIEIGLSGKGDIEIDECSLMRADNVDGIRKDFYDYFEVWKPGIIRYPGGIFADAIFNKLEYCIGPIDKRKSPMKIWTGHYQRMDFGLEEYVNFCEKMNAEKHIVLNLVEGNEIDAREYIEYCNGDIHTEFGALRAKLSRKEPYNISYCEIGNEQWFDTTWMVNKYLKYYDEIIKVDKNIRFLIDGNIWDSKDFFDACMRNTIGKCHNYSYHFSNIAIPADSNVKYNEDDRFGVMMVLAETQEYQIKLIADWLKKDNYFPFAKQSITEHNLDYRIQIPSWVDTNYLNAALEGGLYQANFLINNMVYAETFELYEKTFGLNHIRIGFNSNGKRTVFPTVLHNSISFLKNHTGDLILNIDVVSPKYDPKKIEGLIFWNSTPYLFANYSQDSSRHYIYMLNRSHNMEANVTIDSLILKNFNDYQVYELYSDSYLDYNSADEPNKIDYRLIDDKIYGNIVNVKPHSIKVIVSKAENSITINNPFKFIINKPEIRFLNLNIQHYECFIYNVLGEKVFRINIENPVITLPNIPSGMYIMVLKNNDKEYRYKFYW